MQHWQDLLIEEPHPDLENIIVLACSDDGLEFLAHHHDALKERYTLDRFDPQFIKDMLDKQRTLELARAAGCAVPNFWKIRETRDLEPALEDVRYPSSRKAHPLPRVSKDLRQETLHHPKCS